MTMRADERATSSLLAFSAEVISYKLKKGGTDTVYGAYTVQCSINATDNWTVEKRYSEFRKLYKELEVKNVELHGYSFPKKKWLFNLSESVLEERKTKLHDLLVLLLSRDPVPVELLAFLESRERLTAHRFLDKERQSLGSASARGSEAGTSVNMRARITSTGSIIDDITCQDFTILKVLGQGSFGRVYLVRPLGGQPSSLYAMKVLRKAEVEKRRQIEHTLTERDIMASMQHSFVLALRVAFQSPDRLFMLTDYCPGGELFFHLKRMRRFTEDMMRFYCAELTVTIEYMHARGVIYRDLKPENVLLDREGHIKLTDFGLSKILPRSSVSDSCECAECCAAEGAMAEQPQCANLRAQNLRNLNGDETSNDSDGRAYTFCGTPEYLAPEMLLHRHKGNGYGKSIDWWALGIVCFELMTGWPPFFDKDFEQMSQKILMKPLRFPSKYGIRPEAQVMVRSLLERDPSSRLPCCVSPNGVSKRSAGTSSANKPATGLQLFKHLPFFQSLDWMAIESRTARPPFLPPMTGGFDDTSNFDKEFTEINISIVSIEGVTIYKPMSEDGDYRSDPKPVVKSTVSAEAKNKREDSLRSSIVSEEEVYKGFNFFDPSFRQSYLTGNASLHADDFRSESFSRSF